MSTATTMMTVRTGCGMGTSWVRATSSALYPLWRVRESSILLWQICSANPFTHAVELIRFGLYGQINWMALAVVVGCTALFMAIAILGYDPARGFMQAKRGG